MARHGNRISAALLLGTLLACGSEPAPPPAGAPPEASRAAPGTVLSDGGLYRLSLRPQEGRIPLGPLHTWALRVETADGTPFDPRRIAVSGGMPQHAHGFQSEPRVTQALGDGEFLIEGVRFHMHGDWTLRLEVVGPAGPDVATFHVHVAPDAAGEAFRPDEMALLRTLSLSALPAAPGVPSNRVASDPRAARLGHRLFFDPALGREGQVSCASCHDPARHFTDGRPTAQGLAAGSRNTPSVVGAVFSPWQFWDGRRDSLWAQALAPLETSHEMGSTRAEIARLVTGAPRYRSAYEELFGPAPDLSDAKRFPERAGPFGDEAARAAWAAMSPADREAVNHAFANAGKAIAAYERLLVPGRSRFDDYVDRLSAGDAAGAAALLDEDEVRGLKLFLDAERTRCLRCHNGPLFTNQGFHDIGSGRRGAPDPGRHLGLQSLLLDEFNCLGPESDAAPDECAELRFLDRRESLRLSGAFKTPGLREVARTAPYFHDGRLATLGDVLAHYRNPPEDPGSELAPVLLTDDEAAALAAFLGTLSGGIAADPAWLRPPPEPTAADSGPSTTRN